jgi:hypothetical protein
MVPVVDSKKKFQIIRPIKRKEANAGISFFKMTLKAI